VLKKRITQIAFAMSMVIAFVQSSSALYALETNIRPPLIEALKQFSLAITMVAVLLPSFLILEFHELKDRLNALEKKFKKEEDKALKAEQI